MTKRIILFLPIVFTLSFFSCKNNVSSSSDSNIGDNVELDLTGEDLYFCFTEVMDSGHYTSEIDLTDFLQSLPEDGTNLSLKLKLTSTANVSNVYARYIYYTGNSVSCESEKIFFRNVRADEEFSTIFEQKIDCKNYTGLALRLSFSKIDYNNATVFENGVGVPSAQPHISARAGTNGLEITLRTLSDESFQIDTGGKIFVLGSPISIVHTNENVLSEKMDYIFPFVHTGETYFIRFTTETEESGFIDEWVKVRATSEKSLYTIINPNRFLNSTVSARYDRAQNKFYVGLNTELGLSDIIDPECVSRCEMSFSVVLGAPGYYSESYTGVSDWWGGNSFEPMGYNSENKFQLLSEVNLPLQWKSGPSSSEWRAHENLYATSASVKLCFTDYPNQEWEIGPIWSLQMNNSSN
ncbi:MAG: hypothetical protein IKR40_10805 [Treponema sp.]|nr:hypothetical protein [Treponema sp.]